MWQMWGLAKGVLTKALAKAWQRVLSRQQRLNLCYSLCLVVTKVGLGKGVCENRMAKVGLTSGKGCIHKSLRQPLSRGTRLLWKALMHLGILKKNDANMKFVGQAYRKLFLVVHIWSFDANCEKFDAWQILHRLQRSIYVVFFFPFDFLRTDFVAACICHIPAVATSD